MDLRKCLAVLKSLKLRHHRQNNLKLGSIFRNHLALKIWFHSDTTLLDNERQDTAINSEVLFCWTKTCCHRLKEELIALVHWLI